jgi:tungstate transport system substrate-binding protein
MRQHGVPLALLFLAAALAALLGGCRASAGGELILATTTSTENSGLLDLLLPRFEEGTGLKVKVIAVGSGAALRMGERGDADVLLAHSPADEEAFMAAGHGRQRSRVMYNDFIIVGPPQDPAGVSGTANAAAALEAIARVRASFVSRGDESGTHAKERELWRVAGVEPPRGESWYAESGQGMEPTLVIAAERDAYTLADRGTWLAIRERVDLPALVEGDERLRNVYHVIVVDPSTHGRVNLAGAQRFHDFLLEPETQRLIGEFGRDRYGQPLFFADAE